MNDKYLQWICGFAIAQGGRIYIGVNDSHEVVVGFYLAGLIESWGRGYYKIRSGFELAGLRVPTFDVFRGGVFGNHRQRIVCETELRVLLFKCTYIGQLGGKLRQLGGKLREKGVGEL